MKFLLLVVCTVLSLTSVAKEWVSVKAGTSDKFKFDPETMAVKFGIMPKTQRQEIQDFNYNLMTRFFDESDNMVAMASFRFQVKEKTVTKDFLRLSTVHTKKGRTYDKRCYDRRIIGGHVPWSIGLDLSDPNVYFINESKSPKFAGRKLCDHWREMLAKKGIVSADIALWDNGRNTPRHLVIKYRVETMETATTTIQPVTYTRRTPKIYELRFERVEAP